MWRALAFLALLALAAFGAVWIADRPGTVTIVWNGYEVATSLAIGLVGVLVAAVAIGLLWAVVRGVIGLPEILVRGSRERRRAKGFTALSRGMVAVGSGDPLAARRHASDAERLLGPEPLTLLLKAQAAQISGDREAAENAFQRMADDPVRVLVLGVASSVLKDGSAADRKRAETVARNRAYAHIVAEKTGVQVARSETIGKRVVVTIEEDGRENSSSVSEYLETTKADLQGRTRAFPVVGRWTSPDGTLYYVAVGGILEPAAAR